MSDALRSARVLIVDDTRLEREMTRDALEGVARVDCCADANEALESLAREPADLVLSDITMPGPSGLDLLERVRREHPGTDFIIITAHASVETAVQALRMGATDYLRKPVDADELALVVKRTLDRRRLLQENVRLRDLLATVEGCRALAPCLEPGEVYPIALDILLAGLGRRRGFALFRRFASFGSDGVAFRGLAEEETGRLRAVLADGKPFDPDAVERVDVVSSGPMHDALGRAGLTTTRLLVVPIRGRATEGGLLAIFEEERPFDVSERERARIVAGHSEVALSNAERYHQAKERAFVDDVTGVYNARYLFTALAHEMRRAERYGGAVAVLFLDLDRFKLVNDRHGHLIGSRTLRRLAEVLAECIRQVDTLARYGGDEFTILLADTGFEEGLQIAERIRSAVEEARFEGSEPEPLRLTVSLGVAAYPGNGRTPEELIDVADKAMYRAKSLGRNRVCSAGEL